MDSVTAVATRAAGLPGVRSSRSESLLVGRTLEQTLLREELASLLRGQGRLVLLSGEAGIGKTTLARDLAAAARSRGVHVLSGACYDLTNTPPYGLWLDLFDALPLDRNLASPPASIADGRLGCVTDQAALFAEVRGFFTALAAAGPAMVLLEDLHWADPASLDLLRHLASRVQRWPLLLLVTYRGDELTRHHPMATQLPALVREAVGVRLNLRRLDGDALRDLVVARYPLAAPDVSRLTAYLDRHADGNPLFATEILRALQENALLGPADDGWELGELDRVVVPAFLRHIIEGRVARLGETARDLLAVAAVIGQEAPIALWAELTDIDDEALLTIVEQAGDAHLLEADPDGTRVRFVHALTREALYAGVLPPRRRLWHRRAGALLAAGPRPDPDAVSYHFQAAGDRRACEWLVKAGDRAQRAYAWLTAAERLQAASDLLVDGADHEQRRGRLACRIAFLKRFSDPRGAIDAIEDAARAAICSSDAVMAAEARWFRGLLLCYADCFRSGLAEMIAGIELLEGLPPGQARVPGAIQAWFASALPEVAFGDTPNGSPATIRPAAADRLAWRGVALGRFLASAGHLRAAADSCARAVAILPSAAEVWGDTRAVTAFAAHGLGIAEAGRGRPDDARNAFSLAQSLFAELDHHAMVAFTLLNEVVDVAVPYDAANPAARRRLAAEAEDALGRAGGALRSGVSPHLASLRCLVLDGRWQEADRILDDLPDPGNAYLRRETTAARAVLARHRGAAERAWVEIHRLLPDGPRSEPGDVIHQEGLFLHRLATDICLDRGDMPTAGAWLEANDRWLAWSESVLGRADGQVAWAQYHLATGDIARACAAAADALVLAGSPAQPLVLLAAHRLLAEIEIGATNFSAAEAHLAVALDLAASCDVPFERALTRLSRARLCLETGRGDEANLLLKEVRGFCEPLGVAPTLARVDALAARLAAEASAQESPAGLTRREVEVLRLLPRGLSNGAIAAALFISPRTVQTHLTNLYAKLGVRGRAEAIALAVGHDLV